MTEFQELLELMSALKVLVGGTVGMIIVVILFIVYKEWKAYSISRKREISDIRRVSDENETKNTLHEIRNFLEILTKDVHNSVNKTQATLIIKTFVKKAKYDIIYNLFSVLKKEYINKTSFVSLVENQINNIFDHLFNSLKEFSYEKIELSAFLNENWKTELTNKILLKVEKSDSNNREHQDFIIYIDSIVDQYINTMLSDINYKKI